MAAEKTNDRKRKLELADENHRATSFHYGAEDSENIFSSGKKVEEGEGPWLISYADMMTLLMGFFALITSFSKIDPTEFEKVKREATQYFGGDYEKPYGELTNALKKKIRELGLEEEILIGEEPDGVKMIFKGTLVFDSGDFQVRKEAIQMMERIVGVVKTEAPNHDILIEGHTDNVPISHPIIASNWELSGLRAARIAQLFQVQGFKPTQITISGWGETRPLVPNENKDGTPNAENRSRNHRVVVKIFRNKTS